MDIEELISQHLDGEQLRRGFEQQRLKLEADLAGVVAEYRQEQVNPFQPNEEARAAHLKSLEKRIRVLSWAIDDIDGRLAGADDALNGRQPNRGERRRAVRDGVKVGD